MPQLFIYAKSSDGKEQTELVDSYSMRADGGVDLFRGNVKGPFATLSPADIAQSFTIMEWDSDLSEYFGADGFGVEPEEDEDGDLYFNVTLPTMH